MVIVQSKDVKKRVNGTKTSVLMPFLMEKALYYARLLIEEAEEPKGDVVGFAPT